MEIPSKGGNPGSHQYLVKHLPPKVLINAYTVENKGGKANRSNSRTQQTVGDGRNEIGALKIVVKVSIRLDANEIKKNNPQDVV